MDAAEYSFGRVFCCIYITLNINVYKIPLYIRYKRETQ